MTFKSWILQFKDAENPIGDLARNIIEDSNFPKTSNCDEILEYLEDLNAVDGILRAFEKARSKFEVELSRQRYNQ